MKLLSILIITLSLSACGVVNDKYDGLIVIDGNGKKYSLKHSFMDAYFIKEIAPESKSTYTQEANSKLEGK